jgi:hypothetical protein
VPGVFVAGNIIKDVQLAIVAAAEGTRAAFGINRALTRENYEKKRPGPSAFNTPRSKTRICSVAGRHRPDERLWKYDCLERSAL